MLTIHIGMHKAGSSTIQAFLAENAGPLADMGVLYPQAGRTPPAMAHHDLAQPLRDGTVAEAWDEILPLAREGHVLLSSEAFCTCDPARLREITEGIEVRVIAWQRNAPEGVVSRYAQATKHARNVRPFDVFFAELGGNEYLLISKLVGRWAEAFGSGAIRVRSLDAEVLAGGDLIVDLLDALGLQDSPGLVRPGPQNISPGWRALEVIRALNQRIRDRGELDPRATRFVRKAMPRAISRAETRLGLYERGRYLNAEQAREMVERYNADIEALQGSGADARLKPIALEDVPTSEEPVTDASIPTETALEMLQTAMVELTSEDFRNWR